MVYLWRAVDAEGEVLDVLIQSRRNRKAALKLMRKLLRKYAFVPDRLVTDDLRSYRAAANELGLRWPMPPASACSISEGLVTLSAGLPFNDFSRSHRLCQDQL
jgi:transposase-like protein